MYKFCRLLFLLLLVVAHDASSCAQGLRFLNPIDSINGRTSYSVFGDDTKPFAHRLTIKFDMLIPRMSEVGYILHVVDEQQNANYNLFYDGRGNDWFELNEEGKTTLIRSNFNRQTLLDKGWVKFALLFDLDKKEIAMTIDGHTMKTSVSTMPTSLSPKIVFGRFDYLIEVPSVTIRNLSVEGGETNYFFPLSQSRSNDVYDQHLNKVGYVANPYWSINDCYHWKKLDTMHFQHNAGATYNPSRHLFYGYTRDTLFIYNIDSRETTSHVFASACPVDINLGMNFLDVSRHKLYTYEVFKYDDPAARPPDEASIASLDLNTLEWTKECFGQLPTQMHHHGSFLDVARRRFCIFGGFGSMQYFRDLHTYDMEAHQWLPAKPIYACTPRYFTSMGIDAQARYAYIFGGMGNESGNQSIGRHYLYDLYRIDLRNDSAKKLWSLDWGKKQNVVPVRNLLVMGDYFYTLCYPEALSESYLRLCRFSLKDGSMEMLGDSIPIHSDKILTNANLYYDAGLHQFVVCVQEFTDDISSTVSLYTIQFPVLSDAAFAEISELPTDKRWYYLSAAVLLVVVGGLWLLYRRHRRKRQQIENNKMLDVVMPSQKPNAIYLFGNFTAYDKKNRDISYLFTDKLRELTCLLLWYHKQGGLSSKRIGTILWGDKPADKIKNSRSVIMNHLRKVLEEFDGITLEYANGRYHFVISKSFYCDYLDCSHQVLTETCTEQTLLGVLHRGKFLQTQNMPSLDQFKSETERILMPVILRMMKRTYDNSELKLTLYLVEAMLQIDPYHIESFSYQMKSLNRLGKVYEAQEASRAFHQEYIKAFGEDFTI
jgi:hypothetical protein